MYFLLFLYIAIIGAVLGSFVTALVHRKRHGWSMLAKRSVCPQCEHALGPKNLIPIVSYVWQRGKCAYCGAPIGRQYVVTELLSVGLFTSLALYLWNNIASYEPMVNGYWLIASAIFVLVVGVWLLALAIYDWRWRELPNSWTLGLAGYSLVMLVAAWIFDLPLLWQPIYEAIPSSVGASLLSGLIAGLFFFLIVWLSEVILHKQGMGMGDVKLAVGMGWFLGFPTIVVSLYVAFIFGAVVSLLLMTGKRRKVGTAIAFGPFLIIGWLVSIWVGPAMVRWYMSMMPPL